MVKDVFLKQLEGQWITMDFVQQVSPLVPLFRDWIGTQPEKVQATIRNMEGLQRVHEFYMWAKISLN